MKKKNKLSPVKAMDLVNIVKELPEPKFLWKGIPEGSTGLITGVAKTGKTTFAENIAISLAVGKKEFFGYPMDEKPRKVLFINFEEDFKLSIRRNIKQLEMLTAEQKKLFSENFYSTPNEFPEFLNTEKDWNLVKDYIGQVKPEVLFMDSISRMCVGEIERSVFAQRFIQNFNDLIREYEGTTIVIHHNTKGNDGPITQDNIAGSRFILQEFQWAYGLANVPTGGKYGCMLFNKHIECDDITAELYSRDGHGWIHKKGESNKFDLYDRSKSKTTPDGRIDNTNAEIIYEYILNQDNQGNQTTSTQQLREQFVFAENSTMSLDTLHNSINKLLDTKKINRLQRGLYGLNEKRDGK